MKVKQSNMVPFVSPGVTSILILFCCHLSLAPVALLAGSFAKISPSLVLRASNTRRPAGCAVWVTPDTEHPYRSLLLVSDEKAQALTVYDMEGRVVDVQQVPKPGVIDVRYNFPLAGKKVDIIAVLQRRNGDRVRIYTIDPAKPKLIRIDDDKITVGKGSSSGCLYHSISTNRFFWINTYRSGTVRRFQLSNNGQGKITATPLSQKISMVSACEGAYADDDTGILYVCERLLGVWAFGADPEWKGQPRLLIKVGQHGLERPVKNIGIFPRPGLEGYILVNSFTSRRYIILDRRTWAYVGFFLIRGGLKSDAIALANQKFSSLFQEGVILANVLPDDGKPYVGVFSWHSLADSMNPPLKGGPPWDPRDPAKRKRGRVATKPASQ